MGGLKLKIEAAREEREKSVKAPGSTYRAEIVGGASDLLSVGGTASLAGTLQLVAGGGTYSFNAPYTVLSAAGGRSGTFGTVNTSGSFGVGVTSEVTYGGNDVTVTLKPGSLVDAGSNPEPVPPSPAPAVASPSPDPVYGTASGLSLNTWSVAAAIDRAVANGADPSFLYQIYARGDRQALIAALGTLSGEVHSTIGMMGWGGHGRLPAGDARPLRHRRRWSISRPAPISRASPARGATSSSAR